MTITPQKKTSSFSSLFNFHHGQFFLPPHLKLYIWLLMLKTGNPVIANVYSKIIVCNLRGKYFEILFCPFNRFWTLYPFVSLRPLFIPIYTAARQIRPVLLPFLVNFDFLMISGRCSPWRPGKKSFSIVIHQNALSTDDSCTSITYILPNWKLKQKKYKSVWGNEMYGYYFTTTKLLLR